MWACILIDSACKKWMGLNNKIFAASGILSFCGIKCRSFSGPVFRYKTYHDMLHKYLNVSIKKALLSRLLTCGVIYTIFVVTPINAGMFKNGFYDQTFPVRLVSSILQNSSELMI